MNKASFARLLLLSAIWGASFLFMRIGAPVLGPSWLIFCRVGLAALFLMLIARYIRKSLAVARHWKHFLILGLLNSTVPFLLFAYAAQTISASLLSILNATSPIWAAAIGAVWLRTGLSVKTLAGMALGVAGVAVLAGSETLTLSSGGGLAVAAALAAAMSYGFASNYIKSAVSVDAFSNAHGSLWAATLLTAPLAMQAGSLDAVPSMSVMLAVFALGVVCSGMAYLLFFRLVSDIGPAPALCVTFLIPVFGIMWGVVFLDEVVGWHTLLGCVAVLIGTALVTGFSVSTLLPEKKHGAS